MSGPGSKVVALAPLTRMRVREGISRPIPVLMTWDEIVDVATAIQITGKSEATIRRLCRRHGLARQTFSNAPLEISRIGLEMALQGDNEALELLRAGRRKDERVQRYLRHLGFPE